MLHPLGAGVIFQPAYLDVTESCDPERKSNQQLKDTWVWHMGQVQFGSEAEAGRKRRAGIKVSR